MEKRVRRATSVVVLWMTLPAGLLASQELSVAFVPDHLGCVVDDETLTEMVESKFLSSQFAHATLGAAPPPSSNYFLWGELTYFEIINPRLAGALGVRVGDCMIALNSNQRGGLQVLFDSLNQTPIETSPSMTLRQLNRAGQSIPWYYAVDFDHERISGLGLWFKEYHPEFKSRMDPALSEPDDISRERGPPEFAHHPDKHFQDVTGVTVAVPPKRRAQLETLLDATGFVAGPDREGPTWATDEFEIEFIAALGPESYAIREIRLSLTRSLGGGQRSYDFGSVTLEFRSEDEAALVFDRPAR